MGKRSKTNKTVVIDAIRNLKSNPKKLEALLGLAKRCVNESQLELFKQHCLYEKKQVDLAVEFGVHQPYISLAIRNVFSRIMRLNTYFFVEGDRLQKALVEVKGILSTAQYEIVCEKLLGHTLEEIAISQGCSVQYVGAELQRIMKVLITHRSNQQVQFILIALATLARFSIKQKVSLSGL